MKLKKAVLIIHGFAGGMYDEEELANYLKLNTRFDIYQFTLPGHTGRIRKVKYQEWINKSEKMINFLINNGYSNIYLIGHSMGGVIATYLAGKYSQVKKLVLAAPAFHYLKSRGDEVDIKDSIKLAPKILKAYGISDVFDRFLKSGIGAAKEFMTLIKVYYGTPREVTCPVLLIQGKSDDIVPMASSKYVYDNVGSNLKRLEYFDDVNHDVFRKKHKEEIFKLTKEFLNDKKDGGIYNE